MVTLQILTRSFTKKDFFLLGGTILLVTRIGIGIFLLILAYTNHHRRKEAERHDYNVRLYRYDRIGKLFYCVDKKTLKNRKTFTREEFLRQFVPQDKLRVKAWIDSISRGEYEEYFSAEIKLNKPKSTCPTIREVTGINLDAHRIHFESYLVPYSKSGFSEKTGFLNRLLANRYLLKREEEARKFLASCREESMGALFVVKIFSDSSLSKEEEKKKNDAVYLALIRFLSKKRRMFVSKPDDEYVLLDQTTFSKFSARNLASTIATSLQQQVNRGLSAHSLTVAIGASLSQDHKGNFRIGIQQAAKRCDAIGSGKVKKQRVLFYDSSFFTNFETLQAEKEEVKTRIKDKTFRTYYTPCLDFFSPQSDRSQIRPSFYLAEFVPYGRKHIHGREDAFEHIKERPSFSRKLFTQITSSFERTYESHKDEEITLVRKIPYFLRKDAEKVFSSSKSGFRRMFLVSESEILNSSEETYRTRKNIRERKKLGFTPALLIDFPSPVLKSRILKLFAYFFVKPEYVLGGNSTQSSLRAIQANYKGYSVPFVYYGLKTTEQAELASHYGARFLLCDSLALPSSRLEPFDAKKVGFFIQDAKKLAPKQTLLGMKGKGEERREESEKE